MIKNMDVDFILPSETGFTIYSKSGCPNCRNIKNLLENKNIDFTIVDCDEYLLFERDNFLLFIKEMSKMSDIKLLFPILFKDGVFIGGYAEAEKHVNRE